MNAGQGIIAPSTKSQTTLAYEAIRSNIVAGRIAPDTKLKIRDLADELNVSPGAVREALSRLVPEQLVTSRDQRGFVATPLSIPDLVDLTDLRCEVETIALRRSVANGDLEWESSLVAATHRLNAIPPREDGSAALRPDWVAAHAVFHAAFVSACGNSRIIALHAQLFEQSERYRGLSAHLATKRNIPSEHRKMLELALARDADQLVAVTIRHIQETTRLIIAAKSR